MADRFATTLPYFSEPSFAARATYLAPAYRPSQGNQQTRTRAATAIAHFNHFVAVLRAAARHDVLVLDSTLKSDLVAAACIGAAPRRWRPKIVLHGSMWMPNTGLRHSLERALVRAADRSICRYSVLSSEEVSEFPRIWGVDPLKLCHNRLFYSMKPEEVRHPASGGGYVFSGGNSHRFYAPLVESARRMPQLRFVLATGLLAQERNLPSNVQARSVSHTEFMALLRNAGIVVLPIKPGLRRSAGQQTYLNAMLLGKPVVVTSVFGVRDHIRHGENGLVVENSAEDICDALAWLTAADNRDAVAAMRAKARETAQIDNFDNHVLRLLKAIDKV